jgi:hypothetical protein
VHLLHQGRYLLRDEREVSAAGGRDVDAGDAGARVADPGCSVQPATLKAMRNWNRPLLVFAPSARDASFVSQQALLEEYADDMMDRNLLYVPVLGHSAHFGTPLDASYMLLKPSEMNAIRERVQIGASDFVVGCLGKTAARSSGQRAHFGAQAGRPCRRDADGTAGERRLVRGNYLTTSGRRTSYHLVNIERLRLFYESRSDR